MPRMPPPWRQNPRDLIRPIGDRFRMNSSLSCLRLVALMIVALAAGWADLAVGQARGVTAQGRAAILAAPATAFDGAKLGDQVVVEYLDFNCPYCKRQAISLKQLIAAEPRAKILYKDWPIFGGVSAYAARAVLAAEWQGRYLAAHDGLITAPSRLFSTDQVREALKMAGVRFFQTGNGYSHNHDSNLKET